MSEIVREGYRQLGTKFEEWRDLLASRLEPGARVLDLGCGAGDSGLQHFAWTGVDLVAEAGFEIERDELVTFREPEGQATFQWILARRGM